MVHLLMDLSPDIHDIKSFNSNLVDLNLSWVDSTCLLNVMKKWASEACGWFWDVQIYIFNKIYILYYM